jgi:hypothetical protein
MLNRLLNMLNRNRGFQTTYKKNKMVRIEKLKHDKFKIE